MLSHSVRVDEAAFLDVGLGTIVSDVKCMVIAVRKKRKHLARPTLCIYLMTKPKTAHNAKGLE